MGRPRWRPDIKTVCVTKDYEENEKGKLDVWYEHLVAVGRPCAIIHRLTKYKTRGIHKVGMRYSVWRTVDPDEQEFYKEMQKLDKFPETYDVIKEFGEFSERVGG